MGFSYDEYPGFTMKTVQIHHFLVYFTYCQSCNIRGGYLRGSDNLL